MNAPVLRPYQRTAMVNVAEQWQSVRSTVIVLPTGCGKTVTFAKILQLRAGKQRGRGLILAHRSELLTQGGRTIGDFGMTVELEQAQERATVAPTFSGHSDVVVGSVQTLRGARLRRWPRDHFGTIIIDEAHHAAAQTYRDILAHFESAKVLGVTATPDRGDGVGLGNVFESVAYEYSMREAVREAWLVPIDQRLTLCDSINIDDVKVTAGDLSAGELGEKLEKDGPCLEIANGILEHGKERPTLVFCASVEQAQAQAQALRDVTGNHGCAEVVTGKTPRGMREEIYGRFGGGDVQYLVNCQVLTEGFDAPHTQCVAVARPTKSRALYAQMIGRGTRPIKGTVDGLPTVEERVASIAASAKPDMLVLDFKGNAGRHDLAGVLDVLAGKPIPDAVRADAERQIADGIDVEKALAEAERRAREQAERDAARASKRRFVVNGRTVAIPINPFGYLDGSDDHGPRADRETVAHLESLGVKLRGVPSQELADRTLDEHSRRARRGLCSRRQRNVLEPRGYDCENMTIGEAKRLISMIAEKEGWRR